MFVGRVRELAEIDATLSQLQAGRGALVLLVGEPGIGKTRLATEVTQRAPAGTRVAWGRCWEAGGAPAFWPWHEALGGLAIQFPAATEFVAGDPSEARFALFRTVGATLTGAAAQAPMVIVLEDLHAADHSTLLLLEFLAAQLRTAPILVIGTYRDVEASMRPEIGDALSRLGRTGTVVQLGRLRAPEVAAFVHDAVDNADDKLIAMVYETTQGNPLFVGEIVRQVRAGTIGAIPLGVREIIRQRIASASAEARRALEVSAVLGVEFDAADVARIVAGAALELDGAVRSGLLTARGERMRFAHALYREALYHDLPRTLRLELHRDAARALAAVDAPLAEIAHHLLEAGPEAAPDAIDLAIRAASQASDSFAFEDALALLERARAAIPDGPLQKQLRCRVTIALGETRIRSGDTAGHELCSEGARLARELGDWTLLALAGLAYGSVFLIGAVDAVLVGMLEESLEHLPRVDSGLRARAMARLAAARQPSGDRPRDIALAIEAIEVGHRVATPRELLDTLASACGALYGAAEPGIRLPYSREQEKLAEQLGDNSRLLHARTRIAMDLLELGDFSGYAALATSYEQLANRIGRAANPWRVPLMRSMLALTNDRFDESERHQAESRRIESELPRAQRAQSLHRICMLRAAERHTELRASVPELRGLWMQLPYGGMLADARVASVLARIGDEAEVRTLLDRIPDRAWDEEINIAALAEAVWLAGTRTEAARLAPIAARYEHRWMIYWLDVEIVEAPVMRVLGYLVAMGHDDWDGCARHHATCREQLLAAGRRAFVARVDFEYGDLLVRHDRDRDRARELLLSARSESAALGLGELVALIDRRHPALAGAPAPRPATAPAARFAMTLEGEYFAIATARGQLRFKATRGMHYLARLVATPNIDVHVLDLAGALDADRGDAGELVDRQAARAYKERLAALRDAAEDAEALGDVDRAERAREDMETIARELARGTGLGGKPRRAESAVDRARSAVQRRLKDAIDRIAEQDADLGTWLRRAVRTGNHCSFQPVT